MRPSKLVVIAVLALAACRTESISDVSTSQVTASITATAIGNGKTDVAATFRDGAASLTFLQLTADDTVNATSGTTTQQMKELSLLGVVTYSTQLAVDADGTAFTVSLTRKKDSGAPSSVATLPPAFTVTPLTGEFSRAAAGPHLVWSNGGTEAMSLLITGECIDSFTSQLPSGASDFTVAANALHKRASSGGADGGTSVSDNCVATAELSRTVPGTLDHGYAGGTVSGVQRRTVTFTTKP